MDIDPVFLCHNEAATLSAITVNFLDGSDRRPVYGIHGLHGNPFWTFQGGLGGIIAASAGNDLYNPYQAFFVAMSLVRLRIGWKESSRDDAVWGR